MPSIDRNHDSDHWKKRLSTFSGDQKSPKTSEQDKEKPLEFSNEVTATQCLRSTRTMILIIGKSDLALFSGDQTSPKTSEQVKSFKGNSELTEQSSKA